MAKLYPFKNNFSSGELSPLMRGRSEHPRYQNGAETVSNWLVLLQGGLMRRSGTVFVAEVKDSADDTLLLSFEASVDDAYILEVGEEYLRFYTNSARVEVANVPVEVVTPYQAEELAVLRTVQANDLMFFVHAGNPPYRLTRIEETGLEWDFRPIRFDPPPTYETGLFPAATLTPDGVSGDITLTASAPVFLETDVGRQLTAGTARVIITAFTSTTVVDAQVLDAFDDLTPLAAGDWQLLASPAAELKPSAATPAGARIDLDLQLIQEDEPELVQNGKFASATGWDDRSGPVIVTGTHNGGNGLPTLIDTTTDFTGAGVLQTHRARNVTDGSQGVVDTIGTTTNPNDTITLDPTLGGGAGNDWQNGDVYSIDGTGTAQITGGELRLHGGAAGIGWREQDIVTVVGRRYRLTWVNRLNPSSLQIGSTSLDDNIQAEQTYPVQAEPHVVIFTATTTATFLQWRNNQDYLAVVDDVSCKLYSAEGWRSDDVGKWVYLNGGLVKILAVEDATKARGQLLIALTTADAAAPGAWTLEDRVWTGSNGYPVTTMLFEGRLVFAGTRGFPQHIWESEVDGLFNFARGTHADDAVILAITQAGGNITLNQIRWILPSDRLIVGTTHAEYGLTGTNDDPITPINPPKVRQGSMLGSAAIAPLLTARSILLVQRGGSKLWELQFNAQTEKFDPRDLTILSGHLLENQQVLDQMIYAPEPIPIVWAVRSDGILLGLTYDLTENVIGWHRHSTLGQFESVAAIPHPTRNATQVWVIVRRLIDGESKRYVEYFEIFLPEEPLTGQMGCYLDCAKIFTFETPTAVLTGLEHLQGREINVVGDGGDLGTFTVEDGEVTLPVAVSTAVAGLPFTSRARPLPPDLPQAGSIRTRQKRVVQASVLVHDALGLTVAGQSLPTVQSGMPAGQGQAPYSGWLEVTPMGWDKDGQVVIESSAPFGAVLLAYIGSIDVDLEG
jgi:hypothetical protein